MAASQAADDSSVGQQTADEEADDDETVVVELSSSGEDDLRQLVNEMDKLLDITNALSTPPPLIDIPPLECHALQREELEALSAIYDKDMTLLNDSGTCFCIKLKFLSDEIQEDDVIRIWFSLPPNYPSVPPVFEIEANTSRTFSYSDADELYEQLMHEAMQRIGGTVVFDLVSIALDALPDLMKRRSQRLAEQEKADQQRKLKIELEDALKDKRKGFIPDKLWSELVTNSDFFTSEERNKRSDSDNEIPFVYLTEKNYRPQQFVGSITDIVAKMPQSLQITRMENILRQDLAHRFQQCRQSMIEQLSKKERAFPKMYCLKPQVAFHGTLTKSLPSIVQHGLVIPGKANKVTVRCGSSLGVGIYVSPNPAFSLSYTDNSRLLVCAVLPGQMCKQIPSSWKHLSYYVLMSGDEWVFFNAAQVLPCYVVQIMSSSTHTHNLPPLAGLQDLGAGDDSTDTAAVALKKKQAKLLARARKFLPFGFGPGRKTVIEDAGDIDDDEEDYGDYQMLRYAESDSSATELHSSGVMKQQTELQHYRHTNCDAIIPSSDT